MNLVIVGEGSLGHEVLDLVLQIEKNRKKKYKSIIFADKDPDKKGYCGYETLLPEDVFEKYGREDTKFVIAIGEMEYRKKNIEHIKSLGYGFETLIHPSSYVGMNSVIGEGTIIQRNSFVSCDTKIGDNCYLQPSSNIGHNVVMGNNITISTNCAVSGGVVIGDNTYIGVGSSVIQGIKIGSDTVIGMGSVVFRDVPDNVIALGNPARVMKQKNDSRIF